LLEPRSFDMCKNAAALMIVILGHSEINTEVSDASIETAECQKMMKIPMVYWS